MSEAEALIREMVRFMSDPRSFELGVAHDLLTRIDVYLKSQVRARAFPRKKYAVIQGGKQ